MARKTAAEVRPQIKTLEDARVIEYAASDLYALGLTRGDLTAWEGEVITPDPSRESGRHRRFSLFNLVEAHCAKKMSSCLKTSTIRKIMDAIRNLMRQRGWCDYYTVFEGWDNPLLFNVTVQSHPGVGEFVDIEYEDEQAFTKNSGFIIRVNLTAMAEDVLNYLMYGSFARPFDVLANKYLVFDEKKSRLGACKDCNAAIESERDGCVYCKYYQEDMPDDLNCVAFSPKKEILRAPIVELLS